MSQLEKIYGIHAVEALLRHHPKRVKHIWLAESRNDPRVQTLIALAAAASMLKSKAVPCVVSTSI